MAREAEMLTKELPLNFGPLKGANANARFTGPCGDTMEFWLIIDKDIIIDASFTTDGCENSILCGSAASYLIKNKSLVIVSALTPKEILSDIGYLPNEFKHCALLAVTTIKKTIDDYKRNYPQHSCREKQISDNDDESTRKEYFSDESKHFGQLSPYSLNKSNLSKIKCKIAVLSGKGGVGKSTVAVNLAVALVAAGYKVGLMDVDLHGPSIPTLLGLNEIKIESDGKTIMPVISNNLRVLSVGFFLENNTDALIWRGPKKIGIIDEFLYETNWGELDFLILDLPPGTGDEPLSIGQAFSDQDAAIIVTTPQEVAIADVSKSINFCHTLRLTILGIIENMSGFICPKCSEVTYIFGNDGGKSLAKKFNLPLLGTIPIDPTIVTYGDLGQAYIYQKLFDNQVTQSFKNIINVISHDLGNIDNS